MLGFGFELDTKHHMWCESLHYTGWDEAEGILDRNKFIGHVEHDVVISSKSFSVFNYFFPRI